MAPSLGPRQELGVAGRWPDRDWPSTSVLQVPPPGQDERPQDGWKVLVPSRGEDTERWDAVGGSAQMGPHG